MSATSPIATEAAALGLVVGKFAPLHEGHEWLIEQAARQCESLLILSYSNPELPRCPPETRRRWLESRFPSHQTVVIDDRRLNHECRARNIPSSPLPANDARDEEQQNFLAWILRHVLRVLPDTFFCCEAYVPSCAELLTAPGDA